MIIVKKETYVCEICGNEFDEEYDCIKCERSHVIDFTDRTNSDLRKYLNQLAEDAYDYRIGEKVMGLHIKTFKNLMYETIKRLGEEE